MTTLKELATSLSPVGEAVVEGVIMGLAPPSGIVWSDAEKGWNLELTVSITDGTASALVRFPSRAIRDVLDVTFEEALEAATKHLDYRRSIRLLQAKVLTKKVRVRGSAQMGPRGMEIEATSIEIVEDAPPKS